MRLVRSEFLTRLNEVLDVFKSVVVHFGAEGVVGVNHSLETVEVSGKWEVCGLKNLIVIDIDTSKVCKDVINSHSSGNFSDKVKLGLMVTRD